LEEEVVKVLENTTPIKMILKATYVCRSCGEKFSRIFCEDVDAKKRPQEWRQSPGLPTHEQSLTPGISTTGETKEPVERLRFLDNL